jgi:hypothetical protein
MYYQVEKRFELKREEIPGKLEVFSEALDGLFGYGAKVIEFQIARSLCEKLDLEFEDKEDWTLRDYAEHLEKRWHKNHKLHAILNSVTPLLTVLSSRLLNSISLMKLVPNCSY